MNKIVVITDTHLKQGNEELVYNIFEQTIQYCLDNNIKRVFHAGDFFTSRTSQSLSVLKTAKRIFDLFWHKDIGLTIIPGNHDCVDLESEDSYLDMFDNYPNIQVIKKETFEECALYGMYFLPYFKENGSYLERLEQLTKYIDVSPYKKILITHIGVSGVKNNDGSVVENNLKSDLFKQFDLVLTGHYHKRDQLADNIWYIGSSHPQNYGEDNDKGICVVSEDLSMEFVQLNFPKYFTYKFNCSDLKGIKDQLKQTNHVDNFRFIVSGNETELENFNRSIFDSYKVDVKYEKTYLDKKVELKKYKEDDILQSFEQFAVDKQLEPTIKEKSKKYLKKVL